MVDARFVNLRGLELVCCVKTDFSTDEYPAVLTFPELNHVSFVVIVETDSDFIDEHYGETCRLVINLIVTVAILPAVFVIGIEVVAFAVIAVAENCLLFHVGKTSVESVNIPYAGLGNFFGCFLCCFAVITAVCLLIGF